MQLIFLAVVIAVFLYFAMKDFKHIVAEAGLGFALYVLLISAGSVAVPIAVMAVLYFTGVKAGDLGLYKLAVLSFLAVHVLAYLRIRKKTGADSSDAKSRMIRSLSRETFFIFIVFLFLTLILLPKALMLIQVAGDGKVYSELVYLRQDLENFHRENGRYPEHLADLGAVPGIEIRGMDAADYTLHYHPKSNRVIALENDLVFDENENLNPLVAIWMPNRDDKDAI